MSGDNIGRLEKEKTSFSIRSARSGTSDVDFILQSFDSTLTFLSSIGSGSQWGKEPFSKKPAFVSFVQQSVTDSVEKGSADCLVYVAEQRDEKSGQNVSCGAVILHSSLPNYVLENNEAMSALSGLSSFLYLNILITDRRVYPLSKGAGEILMRHVKNEASRLGFKTLLVDCWDGNNGALVSYYRKHGFKELVGISKMGKHTENVLWTGMLLREELD